MPPVLHRWFLGLPPPRLALRLTALGALGVLGAAGTNVELAVQNICFPCLASLHTCAAGGGGHARAAALGWPWLRPARRRIWHRSFLQNLLTNNPFRLPAICLEALHPPGAPPAARRCIASPPPRPFSLHYPNTSVPPRCLACCAMVGRNLFPPPRHGRPFGWAWRLPSRLAGEQRRNCSAGTTMIRGLMQSTFGSMLACSLGAVQG